MSTVTSERAALEAAIETSLREASGLAVLFSQAVADRVDMSPTDIEALDVLVRSGPITAGRFAELTGLTSGAITGLVDRLERRAYVRREPNPADRRSVLVCALDQAVDDLTPVYAGMRDATVAMLARYSDDELALILEFFNRATAVTNEQIARLRAGSTIATQEPRATPVASVALPLSRPPGSSGRSENSETSPPAQLASAPDQD